MQDEKEENSVKQAEKDFLNMVNLYPVFKALGRTALVAQNYSSTLDDFIKQRKASSEKWRFSKQVPLFTPTVLADARAKHMRDTDYEQNLNYQEITKSIEESINANLKARIQTFDGLLDLTDNEKLKKNLEELDNSTQDTITNLLKTAPILLALNKIKDSLADLEGNVSLNQLYQLRWEAEQALKAQQEADIAHLERLFAPESPLADLKKNKNSMVQTLKNLHEKTNTEFDNRMTDEIALLHNTEENRLNALIILSQNPEMAAKIKQISDVALNSNAQGTSISVTANTSGSPSKKDDHFKGVTLDKLTELKTMTDRSRNWYDLRWSRRGKINRGNDSLNINLPHRVWDSFYYESLEDNLKSDLLELAILLKTQDPKQDSVTLTIDHTSDAHARDVAIAAYAAFREMGYKTIDIKINGQLIKLTGEPDEHGHNSALFANPKQKQVIDERAGLYDTTRTQTSLDRSIKSYQEFTKELRTKDTAEAAPTSSKGLTAG